jgi:hypothetical protein
MNFLLAMMVPKPIGYVALIVAVVYWVSEFVKKRQHGG